MNHQFAASIVLLLILPAGLAFSKGTSTSRNSLPAQKGIAVTAHAKGTFDVKLTPQPADVPQDPTQARMTIEKQIHGDLEGTSRGQMLTGGTDVKGSAVYVAIERITGKLAGRSGSFLLHHTGIMTKGEPHLAITVVPDSGTGELTGITGTFNITITEGKHFYDFEYTLPPAA